MDIKPSIKLKKNKYSSLYIIVGIAITSLALLLFYNTKDYLALKADIIGPEIKPITQSTPEDIEVTTKKLPSIEPNLDALKTGQKTGIIGRDNPMGKLFITEEDLDQILVELEAENLSDEEMQYIVTSLAVNTSSNYATDKNFIIQTVLELEKEKETPTTPSTNTDTSANTGANTSADTSTNTSNSSYNSLTDFIN